MVDGVGRSCWLVVKVWMRVNVERLAGVGGAYFWDGSLELGGADGDYVKM